MNAERPFRQAFLRLTPVDKFVAGSRSSSFLPFSLGSAASLAPGSLFPPDDGITPTRGRGEVYSIQASSERADRRQDTTIDHDIYRCASRGGNALHVLIEIDAHPKRRFDAGLFVGDFTRGLAHREAFQRNFSQVDRRKNRRHLR